MAVNYLDTDLELNEFEALQRQEVIDKMDLSKESNIMEFLTKVEKDALVRGREEGRQEGREESKEETQGNFITRIRDGLGEHEIELTPSQADALAALSEAEVRDAFALLHRDASALPAWLDQR